LVRFRCLATKQQAARKYVKGHVGQRVSEAFRPPNNLRVLLSLAIRLREVPGSLYADSCRHRVYVT